MLGTVPIAWILLSCLLAGFLLTTQAVTTVTSVRELVLALNSPSSKRIQLNSNITVTSRNWPLGTDVPVVKGKLTIFGQRGDGIVWDTNDIEGGLRIGQGASLVFKTIRFKNFGIHRISCKGHQPFFPFFSFDEQNSTLSLEGVDLAYDSQFCRRSGETLPALGMIRSYGEAAEIRTSHDIETDGTIIQYGHAPGHRCLLGVVEPLRKAADLDCVEKGKILFQMVKIYCSALSEAGSGTGQSRTREVMDAEQLLMQITSSAADAIRLLVPTKLYKRSRPSGGIGVRRHLTVESENSVHWIIEGDDLLLFVLPGAHLKFRQLRISVEGNASFSTMGVDDCANGSDYFGQNSLLILGGVVMPGSWAQLSFEGVHIQYETCISSGVDLAHYAEHLQSPPSPKGSLEAGAPRELVINEYEIDFPIFLGGLYTGSTRIALSNTTIACNAVEARQEIVDPIVVDQGDAKPVSVETGSVSFPVVKFILLCTTAAGCVLWVVGGVYWGLKKRRR